MNNDAFEAYLRHFETAHDLIVLPGIHMVARLDGRSFSRLTKEIHQFEAPFDSRFRDMMLDTVEHLMTCGFRIIYAYTQSDEISLLFHPDEGTFARKLRKYNSVLAGEASACFSLKLGDVVAFDCRISQLPRVDHVIDYFRWRQDDAHRNALSAHCYWLLRQEGKNATIATNMLHNLSPSGKNELLFKRGINFNDLPSWQKRGVGFYWETYQKEGYNPQTGETVMSKPRKRILRDLDLPLGEPYGQMIGSLLRKEVNQTLTE